MGKSYKIDEIQSKLVGILKDSATGLTGVEISQKLGINRVTMTKYLKILSSKGLIGQKEFGNVNLWYLEGGSSNFQFPNDFFKVQSIYLENLLSGSQSVVYNLIKNCLFSKAKPEKIISEIIEPAILSVENLYAQGKIGRAEEKFYRGVISNSIQIISQSAQKVDFRKNILIISADEKNLLLSEGISAAFYSLNWNVSFLGDMSKALDVFFDLDLEKFLLKSWKNQDTLMIIVVLSSSQEGLKFFSGTVNSIKKKFPKNFYLVLQSPNQPDPTIKADLLTQKVDEIFQWTQTKFESSIS